MKNILLVLFIIFCQSFIACNDWLDVSPKSEIDLKDQLSKKEGYVDMLNGVYMNMTGDNLYGHQLTYGAIEIVAQNHFFTSNKWMDWKYSDYKVKNKIKEIFSGLYNAIANTNTILDNIDGSKEMFSLDDYNVIKGEALALRAFLHFDALRLFGESYGDDTKDNISIPYVFSFDKVRYPHLPQSKVYEYILADLNKAEELLKESDPIIGGSYQGDLFSAEERSGHFNYASIQALKARVYITMGDKENAYKYATKVINDLPWSWTTEDKFVDEQKDVLFFSELIMVLNVDKLDNYYESYFADYDAYTTYGNYYAYSKLIFEVEVYDFNSWMMVDGPGINDWRYNYLFKRDKNSELAISNKYNPYVSGINAIPLMRITEMMLIAAEACLSTDKDEAIQYVKDIRSHRGVETDDLSSSSEEEIMDLIVNEARKEFYLEGQIFYMYKRLRLNNIRQLNEWSPFKSIEQENYVFPMPDDELEFGYIPKK